MHQKNITKLLIIFLINFFFIKASEGDLDTTFNSSGTPPGTVVTTIGTNSSANVIKIQDDQKIICAGSSNDGVTNFFTLTRYNSDGTLDTTFGTGGIAQTDLFNQFINSIALQADQKILATGPSLSFFIAARFNTDGSLDTSYGSSPGYTRILVGGGGGVAKSSLIQDNQKYLIAGPVDVDGTGQGGFGFARFNTDGSLDTTTFNPSGTGTGGVAGIVYFTFPASGGSLLGDIALQNDQKIVATGETGLVSGVSFATTRLNTDGSVDTTFGTSGYATADFSSFGATAQTATAVAIQEDQKIVVAGNATFASSPTNRFALLRYNTNGSLDTTFGTGGKVIFSFPTTGITNSNLTDVAIQLDGKIIAVGNVILSSNSDRCFALARFNTDGTIDTTFGNNGEVITDNINGIGNQTIASVALQSNGKIDVTGFVASPNRFATARYIGTPITITITSPSNGSVTNNTTPTISGNATPNVIVNVVVKNSLSSTVFSGSTTSDATTGNWSVGPTASLPDDTYTITASLVNGTQAISTFTVDTSAPTLTITSPANNSVSSNNQPIVSGTTEVGLTIDVEVKNSSNVIVFMSSAVADIAGNWQTLAVSPALADDTYTVTATTQDAAGNMATTSNTFTVDTTAPTLTITSPANNSIIKDRQPEVLGTSDPSLIIDIEVKNSSNVVVYSANATTDVSGNWTPGVISPALADDTYTITATTQDSVGNVATTSNTFTVDTSAPFLVITNPSNNAVINSDRFVVSGLTDSPNSIQVTIRNSLNIVVFNQIVSPTSQTNLIFAPTSNWQTSQTPALPDGNYTVTAITQDDAGNVSTVTNSFTINTSVPFLIVESPKNGQIISTPIITIFGVTNPNTTVIVSIDGNRIGTVTSDSQGRWSIVSPRLTNGKHVVVVLAVDSQGNIARVTITITVNLCTRPADSLTKAIRRKYGS